MALSVTEKEEIKRIIEERINQQITRIQTENKIAASQIKKQARQQAVEALGLTAEITEMEQINTDQEKLNKRKEALESKVMATLGVDIKEHRYYNNATMIEERLKSATASYEDTLLKAHPQLGRIVTLNEEKMNLLQSVWIATSSAQVKLLFEMVNKLLNTSPTELENMAQRIPPDQSS